MMRCLVLIIKTLAITFFWYLSVSVWSDEILAKHWDIRLPDRSFLSCAEYDGRYVVTIPEETLDKEMLFVTQLTGNAFDFDVYGAGKYLTRFSAPLVVFVFEEMDNKILMRFIRQDIASNIDGETSSSKANNLAPIFYVFDIESRDVGRGTVSIDVTDLFASILPWVEIPSKFGISGVDKSRSGLKSFRISNDKIEFRQLLTYRATSVPGNPTNAITLELTHAVVLLPENSMIPRLDLGLQRFYTVHWFDLTAHDFVRSNRYIFRWRMQPSDWGLYNRDQLVLPVHPITFYIDPSIPPKWGAYVKRGIEDWNEAFEYAGFKDAVRAIQAGNGKRDWQTPEMRAVVRYVPRSKVAYASIIHDPRTGEILECSIQFGQDMIESMADQFFVQTAAANEIVRGKMPDSVKGELVRALISHEVGHALGLQHNMSASRAYPVDSLRSPSFTAMHGLSASIMDYTCGNHIAQPGDGVKNFYRRIGELDCLAIAYGYKPVVDVVHPFDEISFPISLNQSSENFIIGDHYDDTAYELGDDAVYAAILGTSNLKLVVENLEAWADVDDIKMIELYESVFGQYEMLMRSVSSKLGILDATWSSLKQDRRHLSFLNATLFDAPEWLTSINRKYSNKVSDLQERTLHSLLGHLFATRMRMGDGTRTLMLLVELSDNIFRGIEAGDPVNANRRRLQSTFVRIIIDIYEDRIYEKFQSSDYNGAAMLVLTDLLAVIGDGISIQQDAMSKVHLNALLFKIKKALNVP